MSVLVALVPPFVYSPPILTVPVNVEELPAVAVPVKDEVPSTDVAPIGGYLLIACSNVWMSGVNGISLNHSSL